MVKPVEMKRVPPHHVPKKSKPALKPWILDDEVVFIENTCKVPVIPKPSIYGPAHKLDREAAVFINVVTHLAAFTVGMLIAAFVMLSKASV